MQTKGTYRSVSPMAAVSAYLIALAAAMVPALVSVYNPHQYESDPLFEPVAVRNVLVAVAIAVPLAWLFGRRWPKPLVTKIALAGVVLTLGAVVLVGVASARPMASSGPFTAAATVMATLAIPCTATLALVFRKNGGE